MTWEEYHMQFMNSLTERVDQELVESYNRSVGIRAFGVARSAYLSALRKQFEIRGFDFSMIGDDFGLSFKRKIRLYKGKLIPENVDIIYKDSDEMQITFSSLIIKVKSINMLSKSLDHFQQSVNMRIFTNGHLVILNEMKTPPTELLELTDKYLIPLGYEYENDYLFLDEQLLKGVGHKITPHIHRSVPGSESIKWLETFVRLDGNFVKFAQ